MTTFYLAAAALTAVALLVLLRPWWLARFTATRGASEIEAMQELNTAIYRDQIDELERDRKTGQLAATDYVDARDELQRRLLNDTRERNAIDSGAVTGSRHSLWILLALLIPVASVGLYATLGSPQAVLTPAQQDAQATANMEKLVGELALRLENNPDNPEGWAMLARSYAALGRYQEGEKAFERIGPTLQTNPALLIAYAEFLLRKTSGDFSGRPRELLAKALQLEPRNMMGRYLSGMDALQAQRWQDVVTHWEPLLNSLEPGSEDAEDISAGLKHARQQLGMAASNRPAKTGKTTPEAPGKTLGGRVELAPGLRTQAKPGDALFIFARAEGGPRMPLAAVRLTVADLPYSFTLSDENALGSSKLSEANAIRIEARVAKSGSATSTSGDLSGRSGVVKPGAKDIRILIDTVTP